MYNEKEHGKGCLHCVHVQTYYNHNTAVSIAQNKAHMRHEQGHHGYHQHTHHQLLHYMWLPPEGQM